MTADNVRYLPGSHPGEDEVVDAEIVPDVDYRPVLSQREQALLRYQVYRQDAVSAYRAVKVVATHEHTRRTGRQVKYVGLGAAVVAKRAFDARSAARYARYTEVALMAGDQASALEWEDRKARFVRERHERRMALLDVPLRTAKAAGIGLGVLAGSELLLGIILAAAEKRVSEVAAPFETTAELIRWVIVIGGLVWGWAVTAALVTAILALRVVGQKAANETAAETQQAYTVAQQQGGDPRDIIPTDSSLIEAMRTLGIAELNKAFRKGWGTPRLPVQVFEQGLAQDGCGWSCRIRPPQGVNVEMLNAKKAILAHNLVRLPREVWITEPRDRPGTADIWIAKAGALTGPVPEWPLLADLEHAQTDYFTGVPVGVGLKGNPLTGLLSEKNYAMAGQMGSGKSTMAIALLAGALLDPLVSAEVYVMAENADYDALKPRLDRLVTGIGEDTVAACLRALEAAYDDLAVRGTALKEYDARAVTRELALEDERLRPRIIVVDECQALFMDEQHGEKAADTAIKLMMAARKYAYTLIFITPEPSSTSLPAKMMRVIANKACFSIGDYRGNDAILGTGSFKAGISAVGLEPKTEEGPGDIGTCIVRGIMPKPGPMRCYYLTQDQVHQVTKRAMALRHGQPRRALEAAPTRDLLADVATVIGDATERVMVNDLPALLKNLAPRHTPYQGLTGKALKAQLQELNVRVYSTDGKPQFDPIDVRTAVTMREDVLGVDA